MNWKETYTKIFLQQSGRSVNPVSIKEHLPVWWQNTRNKSQGGLRLTDEGYKFVKNEIDLQFYEIPLPKDQEITTQIIIFLDKFIDCPYYLDAYSMFVTDEKKALELSLFSGDLRKYGLTKALQRQKES